MRCRGLTFRGEEMQSVSKILRSSSAASRASCVSASSDAIPLPSSSVLGERDTPLWISRSGGERNETRRADSPRERHPPHTTANSPLCDGDPRRRGASAPSGVVKHRPCVAMAAAADRNRPIDPRKTAACHALCARSLRREPSCFLPVSPPQQGTREELLARIAVSFLRSPPRCFGTSPHVPLILVPEIGRKKPHDTICHFVRL